MRFRGIIPKYGRQALQRGEAAYWSAHAQRHYAFRVACGLTQDDRQAVQLVRIERLRRYRAECVPKGLLVALGLVRAHHLRKGRYCRNTATGHSRV